MKDVYARLEEDSHLRGLSARSRKAYLGAARQLERHSRRPPDELGDEEVRGYFLHLIDVRRVSPSTVNQHLYAIRFLFRMTLKRELLCLQTIRPKKRRKLPVVLSVPEVRSVLKQLRVARISPHRTGWRTPTATPARSAASAPNLRAEDVPRLGITSPPMPPWPCAGPRPVPQSSVVSVHGQQRHSPPRTPRAPRAPRMATARQLIVPRRAVTPPPSFAVLGVLGVLGALAVDVVRRAVAVNGYRP